MSSPSVANSDDVIVGVGLRPTHYPHLEHNPQTQVQWFEAISENHMSSEGRPMLMLENVRSHYPLALHGVGMSIGSATGVNIDYLRSLKKLTTRIDPFLVSDHLCWTGAPDVPTHDLLPLPYTRTTVEKVVSNIHQAQDFLQRRLCFENISSYISYRFSEMSEWEFINEIQSRTQCGLLLDLNNVYVNSQNHHFNPLEFLHGIPLHAVQQIHLAGHSDRGDFLFDTHSDIVCEPVWQLLRETRKLMTHSPPLLIEWDELIPEWHTLEQEALIAKKVWTGT